MPGIFTICNSLLTHYEYYLSWKKVALCTNIDHYKKNKFFLQFLPHGLYVFFQYFLPKMHLKPFTGMDLILLKTLSNNCALLRARNRSPINSINFDTAVLFSSEGTFERGLGCSSKSSRNRKILRFYELAKEHLGLWRRDVWHFETNMKQRLKASQKRVSEID